MITRYEDLPLGKYNEIMSIAKGCTEDDITGLVQVLSILTDKAETDIMQMDLSQFSDISQKGRFLYTPMREPDARRVLDKYKLGDLVLVPIKSYAKMNAAQFIDFQTFAKIKDRDVTVELLSCLMVPEGHKYADDYDVLDVHKAIRERMPVTDAQDLTAFFFARFEDYLRAILIYSGLQVRRLPKEKRAAMKEQIAQARSRIGGVGQLGLTRFPNVADVIGTRCALSE